MVNPVTNDQYSHELWEAMRTSQKEIVALTKNQEAISASIRQTQESMKAQDARTVEAFTRLNEKIDKTQAHLSDQIASATKAPWQGINTGLSLFSIALAIIISLIAFIFTQNITHVTSEIKTVEEVQEHQVPREEHELRWKLEDERLRDYQRFNKEQRDDLRRHLQALTERTKQELDKSDAQIFLRLDRLEASEFREAQ